jgi:hypothetical protein
MDLSNLRFDRDGSAKPLPSGLAVLLAAAAGRQAASATAQLHARLAATSALVGPDTAARGAFNNSVATLLDRKRRE